jgi:hypothetical protein
MTIAYINDRGCVVRLVHTLIYLCRFYAAYSNLQLYANRKTRFSMRSSDSVLLERDIESVDYSDPSEWLDSSPSNLIHKQRKEL